MGTDLGHPQVHLCSALPTVNTSMVKTTRSCTIELDTETMESHQCEYSYKLESHATADVYNKHFKSGTNAVQDRRHYRSADNHCRHTNTKRQVQGNNPARIHSSSRWHLHRCELPPISIESQFANNTQRYSRPLPTGQSLSISPQPPT